MLARVNRPPALHCLDREAVVGIPGIPQELIDHKLAEGSREHLWPQQRPFQEVDLLVNHPGRSLPVGVLITPRRLAEDQVRIQPVIPGKAPSLLGIPGNKVKSGLSPADTEQPERP